MVTPVDFDHEAYLGKSLESIAGEKAGILKPGVPAVFARHARHAEATRRAVRGWGLEILAADPREYSNTLTAVVTPEGVDADRVRAVILEHFDLSLGTGLGKVKGRVFRIGHLGSFNDLMLAGRLRGAIAGDVFIDRTTRGMYATDASIYQIMPLGVVIPRTAEDIEATIAIAREAGVSVTARGGGTSQCGQTVNHGLIVDVSPHLHDILALDTEARTVRVQPGIVLDALNRALKPHGLFFPVDPSTASRCTIGGMTANNSSGARSIRYGIMADNVLGIDAVLADGTRAFFGDVEPQRADRPHARDRAPRSARDRRSHPQGAAQRRRLCDPNRAPG